MTERTRMLSVRPGTPAGSMQAPRTIRSMRAPRRPARTSASISGSSVSAFIFSTMRAVQPAGGGRAHQVDVLDQLALQLEGRQPSVVQPRQPALAGQVHEHLLHVGGELRVGREVAQVGVQARRARVVVAGGQVGIAHQAAGPRGA